MTAPFGRRARAAADRLACERGSAVAEFPMVAALLVIIALAVIQVAVVLHVRNTVTDAAVQGAREAAILGHSAQDGTDRTQMLIRERLGRGYTAQVTTDETADGRITVTVRATMPLVGLLGPSRSMTLTGNAVAEEVL